MSTENLSFTALVILNFILLSSYAQIPVFMSFLKHFDPVKQKKIIFREMVFALIILLGFIFFGPQVLTAIGIKQPILGITGGGLLIIIALNMIFPKNDEKEGMPKHEPFIVPLALPCIAGPGTLTTLMVLTKQEGYFMASSALFLAWIPSTLLLLAAPMIKRYLGEKGLHAIERLGGMIIALIGIQMAAIGILDLVKDYNAL